jgi:hypothetical protein
MRAADLHAERARKNRLLAMGLLVVSILVLGLMLAVVFGVRSGLLGQLIEHIARSAEG